MSKTIRNLIVALAVSLVINVFFVGLWAGRSISRWRGPRGPEPVELTERAPSMREMWNRHGPELNQRREAVGAARRAAREALIAEPFKAELLEAALASLRTETSQAQTELHRALLERAREATPEDRKRLAESRWFDGGRGQRVRRAP